MYNYGDAVKRKRYAVVGCLLEAPTTTSVKTDNNVNLTSGYVIVKGVKKLVNKVADLALPSLIADEKEQKFLYIAVIIAGVVSLGWVSGAAVAFGTTPADVTAAEVAAAFPGNDGWLPIGQVHMTRTGDTTLTQVNDNTLREVANYFLP